MKLLLLISLGVILFTNATFSQVGETFNADSLFMVARQKSIDGQYDEATALTQKILATYPEYTDARILLARTYAWQNDFDMAEKNIMVILGEDPQNYDANSALIDFYFWNEDYNSAIDKSDEALNLYPNDLNLLTKKAKIQLANGDYKDVRSTLKRIEELEPGNESLPSLKDEVSANDYSNIIRVEHYFDSFDQPYRRRWHMSSAGYGRNTSFGVFYGKVYWGDMVGSGEKLFSDNVSKEYALEFYPKFNKSNYMYLNYSFSNDAYFPKNRFGIEYYHVFKYKIEASLGYRYMNFPIIGDDDLQINIYTGSIAKYIKNYWISFRPYMVYDGSETSYKYTLSVRNYLKKNESYLELVLGTGVSPDNPLFYTSGENIPQLGSWRVELEWKQKVMNFLLFEIEGGYENAEYMKGFRRDQLSLRTSLSFLF